MLTEAQGIPVGLAVDGANRHDIIESPRCKVERADGLPTQELNHAIGQIKDWREWLTNNLGYARGPKDQHGLETGPETPGWEVGFGKCVQREQSEGPNLLEPRGTGIGGGVAHASGQGATGSGVFWTPVPALSRPGWILLGCPPRSKAKYSRVRRD